MNDEQLLRHSRHLLLPELDVSGVGKLLASRVLLIGAGGLGTPCALYLAAAGIGELTICDPDHVELSNLQRQIAYSGTDIGSAKVDALARRLSSLNPDVRVRRVRERVGGRDLIDLVERSDIVIDATDQFSSRFEINRACVASRRPLVSGAAIRWEGQVCVFDARLADAPCYRCLYGEEGEEELNCNESGIFAPLAGTVGCLQATEAIKLICGVGECLSGRLLLLDALHGETRTIRLGRDPKCPVCASAESGPGAG